MKNPLLKVQDKLSGTRKIRQLRILTKDDFDIEEKIYIPEHCRTEPDIWPRSFVKNIHAKWSLEMKQEVIDHILDVMNVKCGEGRDGNPLLPQREMLDPFCPSWTPKPARSYAGINREIEYRGIPADSVDRREKKYQSVVSEVLKEWSTEKERYLTRKIIELDERLPKIIWETNRRFDEALKNFIVKLNVKEEWFLENETDKLTALRLRIDELNAEIKAKKELRTKTEAEYYRLRRALLVESIVKDGDFSAETTEEVKRLAAEAPDIPESRRRIFG